MSANSSVLYYFASKDVTVSGVCPVSTQNIVTTAWNNVSFKAGWNDVTVTSGSSANTAAVTGKTRPAEALFYCQADASKLGNNAQVK